MLGRKLPQIAVGLLCVVLLAAPRVRAAQESQPQTESVYGPLPVFELHSGFWVNLHHTLYQEARQRANISPVVAPLSAPQGSAKNSPVMKNGSGAPAPLTPDEQRAWDNAVNYYVANYASKDLVLSLEMVLLKNQLEDFENCEDLAGIKRKVCDAGLPDQLTQVLDAAAPVYRAHQWPAHDRANRNWIIRVAPLVEEQGVGLSQRLADIFQTKWPAEKIRVDVSFYADPAGAYTTLDPLRVTISSAVARNQGDSAFEVLFFQSSHGIAQPVQDAITRECKQRDKAIPRDLWHALIFYTTREVIAPVLGTADAPGRGGSRVAYGIREGLNHRGWEYYFYMLSRFWQPYLDNKSTFDDAIARMVSAL